MLTLQKMPKGLRYQKTCMVVYYDIYIGTGLVLRLLRMLNSGVCTDLNWIIEIIAGLKDLASPYIGSSSTPTLYISIYCLPAAYNVYCMHYLAKNVRLFDTESNLTK